MLLSSLLLCETSFFPKPFLSGHFWNYNYFLRSTIYPSVTLRQISLFFLIGKSWKPILYFVLFKEDLAKYFGLFDQVKINFCFLSRVLSLQTCCLSKLLSMHFKQTHHFGSKITMWFSLKFIIMIDACQCASGFQKYIDLGKHHLKHVKTEAISSFSSKKDIMDGKFLEDSLIKFIIMGRRKNRFRKISQVRHFNSSLVSHCNCSMLSKYLVSSLPQYRQMP